MNFFQKIFSVFLVFCQITSEILISLSVVALTGELCFNFSTYFNLNSRH